MRQIRLSPIGLWHRPARTDRRRTACGILITGAVATRDFSRHGNHLCPICWTASEIDTGELEKLEAEHHAREEAESHFEDEEPTDPDGGDRSKDDS
jgi:hypothetical protein